jgi:hypothetical protein
MARCQVGATFTAPVILELLLCVHFIDIVPFTRSINIYAGMCLG